MKEEHKLIYRFLGYEYIMTGVFVYAAGILSQNTVTLISREPIVCTTRDGEPVIPIERIGVSCDVYLDPEDRPDATMQVLDSLMRSGSFHYTIELNTVSVLYNIDNSYYRSTTSTKSTVAAMYDAVVDVIKWINSNVNNVKYGRPAYQHNTVVRVPGKDFSYN